MQGDLRYFDPGEQIPGRLKADGTGTVAERGDPVELVDETGGVTRIQLAQSPASAVGTLRREPEEYDPDASYSNDEEIGQATFLSIGPVDWYDEAAAATGPAVGDEVVVGSGGVREVENVSATGTYTQDGDSTGGKTTFTVPHGLDVVPDDYDYWAESADAAGDSYVSAVDDTHITVEYLSAPADGADNVTIGFEAHESTQTRPAGRVFATGTRSSAATANKIAVLRER